MKNYEILSLISSSPVSRIYKGLNKQTGETVAIKELLCDVTLEESYMKELIKQFLLEAGLFMKFNHHGLARLHKHIEFEGSRYLVMEFIEGESLYDFVNKMSGFPEEGHVISWGLELCSVLGYLHTLKPRSVIFRNLKPDNVHRDIKGNIKLLGFGLSKIFIPDVKTMSVAKVANLFYSPPEQYSGITDTTSDIYSLGATLYYFITRSIPEDALDRSLEDKDSADCRILNPSVSTGFSSILQKAMKLKKKERYQSVKEVALDLKKLSKDVASPYGSSRISLPPKKLWKEEKKPPEVEPAMRKENIVESRAIEENKHPESEPVMKKEQIAGKRAIQDKKERFSPSKVSKKIRELRSPEKKIKDKIQVEELSEGKIIGDRYKIKELMSSGELSNMYRAVDLKENKIIALKELLAFIYLKTADRTKDIEQFHRETEKLLDLNHPNLPLFLEIFSLEDKYYLSMEYIFGDTLDIISKKQGLPLPVERVIEWTFQLCGVLSYLHNKKSGPVIFRGLCPKNIILEKTGVIKLIDFGISKIFDPAEKTLSISRVANTNFSPPEQYSGRTDIRSDIYSLGTTLYYLLTGVLPDDSVDRILSPSPLVPCSDFNNNIPSELENIIMRATEVNKNERFQSVEDIERRLQDLFPLQKERVRILLEKKKTVMEESKKIVEIKNTNRGEARGDKRLSILSLRRPGRKD